MFFIKLVTPKSIGALGSDLPGKESAPEKPRYHLYRTFLRNYALYGSVRNISVGGPAKLLDTRDQNP